MTEPTDNVSRLARIAKTMEAGHWPSSAKIVREAADEIERLRAECDRLARRNTMLVNELSERGRVFSPEQLKCAIVKALYETEG